MNTQINQFPAKLIDIKRSHRLLLLMLAAFLFSCAEKSLTTDPDETVTAPLITSISPNPAAIGAELIIDGENFGSDASAIKVYIGDVEAQVKSITPTKLIVVVPDGAKAGKGVVKIVKGGKSVQSGDSLTVVASPFPYRYSTVSISGITLEMETRNDTVSLGTNEEVVNYQFVVDGDTCFPLPGGQSCEEGGKVENGNDRVVLSCHQVLSYAHINYGSFRDNSAQVIIDTVTRTFRQIEFSDRTLWVQNTSPSHQKEDVYRLGIESVPYSTGVQGELIAELKGSDLAQANLSLYREHFEGQYLSMNKRTGTTTASLRIVSITPDAVVRIVLRNDGP